MFIYGNDDMFVINKTQELDFFYNGFPKNNIRWIKTENDQYSKKMIFINKILYEKLKIKIKTQENGYFTTFHIQQPYLKSQYEKIFNIFKKEII